MSKPDPAAKPGPAPHDYPFRWAVETRRTHAGDSNSPFPPTRWKMQGGLTTHYAEEIVVASSVPSHSLPSFLHELAAHLDLVEDAFSGDDAFVIVGRRRGEEAPARARGEDETDATYARRLLTGAIDAAVDRGDLDPSLASFLELYITTTPVSAPPPRGPKPPASAERTTAAKRSRRRGR